ncbi:MAG: GNAT family N-acetyltransferase [Epsilonproteobacteria bacterium]|nr:GNAT family N-acetyltransferase [Campylobacterota bacterium]
MKGHIGISSPFFVKKEKAKALIRDIKSEDAQDVVELFRANYGNTYYKKSFYNPKTWMDMAKSSKYYPVVAEIDSKVVGQFLLTKNDDFNGEISAVVVHPDYKGRGLMNMMFEYIIKRAKELKLKAIYGEAIMFHPFSQKANLKHGMIESALQLGEVASFIAQKDIRFEKRSATIVGYLVFDKKHRSIYLPKRYERVIKDRYKKLKIPIRKSPRQIRAGLGYWDNSLLKIAGIVIDAKVDNFKERFNIYFSKAKIEADMIYADVNLHSKNDDIVEFLRKKGFFYCGVLFYRYKGMDYLRMQFENTHNIEERLNVCWSKYCKKLTRYVILDKRR